MKEIKERSVKPQNRLQVTTSELERGEIEVRIEKDGKKYIQGTMDPRGRPRKTMLCDGLFVTIMDGKEVARLSAFLDDS